MKRTIAALLLLTFGAVSRMAAREEVLRTIDWKALAAARSLSSGVIVTSEGRSAASLRLAHTQAGPARFHLVTIDRPAITSARYAVRGQVRYERVAAGSYLEMFNYIGDGSYFSRTLGDGGPMGQLSGTSGWRDFVLPFNNREGGLPPQKLEINLVLTGAGTVDIGPLQLVQLGKDEGMAGGASGWWSDRQAGLVGGLVGSMLGVLGAVIGALGSTGRAKNFVLRTLRLLAVAGLGALVAGVAALTLGQPYAVFYPLLLIGSISAAVGFALPRVLLKRYQELELRRMQALDA
jgi:hypothetical protein